ncbi:MAG: hypothetical protein WBE74_01435 [Terracidiphilus sp.]
MQTYEVEYPLKKLGLPYRIGFAFLGATVCFLLWFGKSMLWPTQLDLQSCIASRALWAAVFGITMGVLQGFAIPQPFTRPIKGRITVDDESIEGSFEFSSWLMTTKHKRTVRKGRVKSIFEVRGRFGRPGGIGISEQSKFGARMLGLVFIPRSMEEFDELKQLAESWRRPAA